MKYRILLLLTIAVASLCSACRHDQQLQTGDMIIVAIPERYSLDSGADSAAAWMADVCAGRMSTIDIHIALVELTEGGDTNVIDATVRHGVARRPLAEFKNDFTLAGGVKPLYKVLRWRGATEDDGKRFIDNALRYIGRGYDFDISLANDAIYCSELVRNAYIGAGGDTLLAPVALDFADGRNSIPLYWQQANQHFGIALATGNPGILPHDIEHNENITSIDVEL